MKDLGNVLEEFIEGKLFTLSWQCEACSQRPVCEEQDDGPETRRYCLAILRAAIEGNIKLEIPFTGEEE